MPAFLQGFIDGFYQNYIYQQRYLYLLKGIGVTLEITLFSILIATVLGIILCLMKLSNNKLSKGVASVYINVIRGTPLVTQLLIIYFGVFGSVNISKTIVAIIAFSLNSAAYLAEIFRSGILSVEAGQTEAGRSLGFNKWQTMFYIVMPQAIKNIVPTYANEFIVLIKETAIVGYIAVEDLTKVADVIRSRTFSAWFPLLGAAAIYLCLTLGLAKLFSILERRLRQSDNR